LKDVDEMEKRKSFRLIVIKSKWINKFICH